MCQVADPIRRATQRQDMLIFEHWVSGILVLKHKMSSLLGHYTALMTPLSALQYNLRLDGLIYEDRIQKVYRAAADDSLCPARRKCSSGLH